MDIPGPGQPKMYFRKANRMDGEEINLDADMIRLLIAIDENKDMSQIVKEVGMDITTLNTTLTKLLKLKLIEPAEKRVPFLNEKFLGALKINLSKAIGPMAGYLIEDVTGDMDFSMSRIPKDQAAELISNLAVEIPDEGNRVQFQKSMIELIKKDKT
jgi:AAA+ ATPase superfamily predicted ATPase